MRLFVDNDLPPRWATALDALLKDKGYPAQSLKQVFPDSAQDDDWIEALADDGDWCVLTADGKMMRQPRSRAIILSGKVAMLRLHSDFRDLGPMLGFGPLLVRLATVLKHVETMSPPRFIKVPFVGPIKPWTGTKTS